MTGMDMGAVVLIVAAVLASLLINFYLMRAAVRQGVNMAHADERKAQRQRERDGTA